MPDNSRKQATSKLQTWICIDLDEPYFSLGIYQKIKPKYLKSKYIPLGPEFVLSRFDTIKGYFFHPSYYTVVVYVFIFEEGLQI